MFKVIKKNNRDTEPFNINKIKNAVAKAQKEVNDDDTMLPSIVASKVLEVLEAGYESPVLVEELHIEVENALMASKAYDVARAYITYRKEHMPDIFRSRDTYRPYEYPQMIEYIDAIHASFWTHKSFNLDSSVQDIRTNMTEQERTVVLRSILSIASVEAKVKSFWSKLGDKLPKAEFEELGTTIGANEVYHAHFYAKVLEQLGLNELFTEVLQTPQMRSRIDYMNKALQNKDTSNKEYIKALTFFSLFVENVSLFSQFLAISVFNKKRNMVSGLAQGISATALEENLHAQVGADIINICRKEHPEWFTDEWNSEVYDLMSEAYLAELNIVDWIYEQGDIEALPKNQVIAYMQMRINKGLQMAGYNNLFEPDKELLTHTEWFELQTKTTIHRDFFSGHSINYDKNSVSFTEDDLF